MRNGIIYMSILEIKKSQVNTLVTNETPFDVRLESQTNPSEPPLNIKAQTKGILYIQKEPELSGTLIYLTFRNPFKD